ncbi:DUF1330 domain-containing protein [Parafrankia discariae]|uniref:DUF1330 domain-containing protein n=1 Tax=Parafrankia discariae TaxID=365528 RepID=UPI0003A2D3B5|nr:DUF1330 domain-containing protein [Parafrankia discariae]
MPKGYVILTENIHDPAGMAAYSRVSGATLAEYGAAVRVVDDNVELIEGEWPGRRTVVLEFESVEQAREWYHSAGYQAAVPLRRAAADCNAIIASGFSL